MDPAQAPTCDHYWAWVSPADARMSARLCMLCHAPDADWLNHLVDVDRGHADCLHCEFADTPARPRDEEGETA